MNTRASDQNITTRRSVEPLGFPGSMSPIRKSVDGREIPTPAPRPVNAMTVDVEDYFQVSAFEPHVNRAAWPYYALRLEPRVERILDLYAAANVKATFFMLGWIAERFPDMVRRIVAEGHELASHGWEHRMVTTQEPREFAEDVRRTKVFLEDMAGVAVTGYRAPSYSINGSNNRWAHAALRDAGYHYSSSIAPINHDLYGWPDASPSPFPVADNALLEVPISTIQLGPKRVACGGGGWFRLYPYELSRRFATKLNERNERYVFYFHPWEIDPEQPRMPGVDLKTRFRHYVNLGRMEKRVERLLEDFEWDRMDRVFHTEIASVVGESATAPSDANPLPRAVSF